MITNLVFVIWGTGDTQPWNDLRTVNDKTNGAIENGGEEKKRKNSSDFDAEIDNNDDEKSTKL